MSDGILSQEEIEDVYKRQTMGSLTSFTIGQDLSLIHI